MERGLIPRFSRNDAGRDFAVGDIHGCFSALTRALGVVRFDPVVDRLFSVGDLVDRGPESSHVMSWLESPWFHAICGNHDFMTWRSALGDPYPDVNHLAHGGEWLGLLPAAERQCIGERLSALPLAVEVETPLGIVGLVHADCPFDDWREMQRVRWDELKPTHPVAEYCLWSIERHARQYAGQVRNIRAVVHGHRTVPSAQVLGNVHFIDTGGWRRGGHFTLLDLHTLKPSRGPVVTK
jgi:serine/threonine protein phosphatase 1